MPELRRAGTADVLALSAMLARGFRDDPVARFLFPDDRYRFRRLQPFFDLQLRHVYLPRGEVYTTTELNAVAMWLSPEAPQLPMQDALALLRLTALLGTRVLLTRRLARFLAVRHPREPHYYLGTIGVEPSRQREGIASALLAQGLSNCDDKSLSAYLECSSAQAIPFYERHGFVVEEEVLTPMDGPRLWLMKRSPMRPSAR